MSKHLTDLFTPGPTAELTPEIVAGRIGVALVLGLGVAGLFKLTFGRKKSDGGAMATTLVLLSILICMITLVIGGDIARAFTLGGALAIIRFRAVVDDTRDTAFVIFSVVIGMGAGAGSVGVILVGMPIVAIVVLVAAIISRYGVGLPVDRNLIVRLALDKDPGILQPVLSVYTVRTTLMGVETTKQGESLEVQYTAKLKDANSAVTLVNQIRAIEGVKGVEVKAK